jgi:hypothetical protein
MAFAMDELMGAHSVMTVISDLSTDRETTVKRLVTVGMLKSYVMIMTTTYIREISGSHGGEYEDGCLLPPSVNKTTLTFSVYLE